LEPFGEEIISQNVLKKLINQDVIVEMSLQDGEDKEIIYLYKRGIAADYFILILQGKVEVTVGQEEFVFEESQFSNFGAPALVTSSFTGSNPGIGTGNPKSNQQYIPDYTVSVLTDITYLKIPRTMYRMAIKATMMERENGSDIVSEMFYGMPMTGSSTLGVDHVGEKSNLSVETSI
jgi:metal transporter CNNM